MCQHMSQTWKLCEACMEAWKKKVQELEERRAEEEAEDGD